MRSPLEVEGTGCRKRVVHAKDKGSTQAAFAGTGTAPDRQELLHRTVSEYLKAAETAGLKWPDIADRDDARIAAALLPGSVPRPARSRLPEPDYTGIHAELQK